MTRVLFSAFSGLSCSIYVCRAEGKLLSCYGRVPNCGTDTAKSFLEYGKADRLYGKVGSNKVSSQQGTEGPFEAFGSVVVWLPEYPAFRARIII